MSNDERARLQKHFLERLVAACTDYIGGIPFPKDLARTLADEGRAALTGRSHTFKSHSDAARSPNVAQTNAFVLLHREWERSGHNPFYIIKALAHAKSEGVVPPKWAIEKIVDAGDRVYRNPGEVTFDEALGHHKKDAKKLDTHLRQRLYASIVAEARDAGLSEKESVELAGIEGEIVYGWDAPKPSSIQKYYERLHDETDRDGFSDVFFRSLGGAGHMDKPEFQSIYLACWRRKALRRRLEAYREAVSMNMDRLDIFAFVAKETLSALRQNTPPTNELGHFVEQDF